MKLQWKLPPKAGEFLKKYRYAALVLLIGVLLLSLPTGRREETEAEPLQEPAVQEAQQSVEEALEGLLRQVDGAGEVCVMLTVAEGERTVYQTDLSTEVRTGETGNETSSGVETVFADAGSSRKEAIPVQVMGPVYQGAVIVAEGGDRPQVRLDLTNAVMSLTGLGADKITVVKMKMN